MCRDFENRFGQPFGRNVAAVIELDRRQHLRSAATCCSYVALPLTVNEMFCSARASSETSGTKCSPELKTRPEKRPNR